MWFQFIFKGILLFEISIKIYEIHFKFVYLLYYPNFINLRKFHAPDFLALLLLLLLLFFNCYYFFLLLFLIFFFFPRLSLLPTSVSRFLLLLAPLFASSSSSAFVSLFLLLPASVSLFFSSFFFFLHCFLFRTVNFVWEDKTVQLKFFISNEINSTQILRKFARFLNDKVINKIGIIVEMKLNEF